VIDLRPDHLEIVEAILKRHVPDAQVRAFGSRVTQTAKDHSDLDLAIIGNDKLDSRTLTLLKLDFEESNFPFRVDVLDWRVISPEFRKLIEQQYEIIQDTSKGDRETGR